MTKPEAAANHNQRLLYHPPLLLAMQEMGVGIIMFSVDYPFSAYERGQAFLVHASNSSVDKEKINHLNAE